MVISSLNMTMLIDRIKVINDSLLEMEGLSLLSKEEFLGDRRNPAAVETYLRHALEAIFDIGRHILAKITSSTLLEYKSIARELGRNRIVSDELSDSLIRMAGYRNRIVHFYHQITDGELYEIIKKDLGDIRRFVKEITFFLEAYQKKIRNNSA